jgi:hypothetical protein
MTQEELIQAYRGSSRVRTGDVGLAINKLKIKSVKTLKDGLTTGKKSKEQIAAAVGILLLVKEYEYAIH